MVAPHTAWRRRCTGLSLYAAASSADHSLSLSVFRALSPPLALHSVHSLRPCPTHVCPPSVLPSFATPATDAVVVVGEGHVVERRGEERRGRTEQDELERGGKHAHAYVSVKQREGRIVEEGWAREREREIERASLHAMGMGNGTPRNIGGH